MRVRIERKLNLKCAAMTELYVDGKREYVSEVNPDVPLSEINIPVHMESERIWIEFEADVEIIERNCGAKVAVVRNIHDCVIGGKDD